MDNVKTNHYYLKKIIKDIDFVLEHTDYIDTQTELEQNEVLLDSVLFRLIQISEIRLS